MSVTVVTQREVPYLPCLLTDQITNNILWADKTINDWVSLSFCIRFYNSLMAVCIRNNATIIHDHGLWLPNNIASWRASLRLNLPLVVQPHGMLERGAFRYKKCIKSLFLKIYQRRILQDATVLVVTSKHEAEGCRRMGLRTPSVVVPIGIDLPQFSDDGRSPPLQNSNEKVLLFLSRLHPIKGLELLIDAWAAVRPSGWKVIVAGAEDEDVGGYHNKLVERIRRLGLERNFEFLGEVFGDQKDKLFRSADLFILPTLSENFGVVVAEALSYGLPVITTTGAPWSDLVAYSCGWWTDAQVEALAKALHEATEISDEKRKEMGLAGRKYVTRYSWPMVIERLIETYNLTVEKYKRSGSGSRR